MDNGLRFFFGTTVGEVVTFSCNTGFELQGNPSRQCNSDGNWSGTVPTCLGKCVLLLNTVDYSLWIL